MSISATYSKDEIVDKEFQYPPEAEGDEKKKLGTLRNNLLSLQNDINTHLTSLLKATGVEDIRINFNHLETLNHRAISKSVVSPPAVLKIGRS
ncbi:895_t:CDS:2 [Paraglomus occultum]|uniref:EKC/KEOPS complex subunit GON7 n=1 Tax=Paraglomus occultum TaxID=144539 RepID=A0A9N9AS94_9GLOM|nr:895_t:CDS:2 [Paraglomus occultum]